MLTSLHFAEGFVKLSCVAFCELLTPARCLAHTRGMSEQPNTPVIPEFDLADRMRKALRHAEVSSQGMSEYLEVSRHTVSNWLNGHTRPRPAELKMWALRCGVDYRWLVHGISTPDAVYTHTPDRPAGIQANPEPAPGYAEVRSPLDEFRKRLPLTPGLFSLLRAVA
jgi:transcriptional regulator with XRE-family HTH domain